MTDPGIVINRARELLGPDVIIDFSTRRDKKYDMLGITRDISKTQYKIRG